MNLLTHFATSFASFSRVIGEGTFLKSLAGICLVHCRYPGH